MIKKFVIFMITTCILLSFAGCAFFSLTPKETIFLIEDYKLQITANSTYREETGGEFDLQITNSKTYISIMAYSYEDLPEDTTALEVFDIKNEDIFSRRDDVKTIEEPQTNQYPERTVKQALYSANKDGKSNYYLIYLIDFPEEEKFAWIIVTATPTYFSKNRGTLQDIVLSLRITD